MSTNQNRPAEGGRLFRQLLASEKRYLLLGAITHLLKNSPVLLIPLITAKIIDQLIAGPDIRLVTWYSIILVISLLQNVPMEVLHIWAVSKASRNIELKLRLTLCHNVLTSPLEDLRENALGSLENKIQKDVETIENYVRLLYSQGMIAVANFFLAFIVVAINIPWFIAGLAVCIPLIAVVMDKMYKIMLDRARQHQVFSEKINKTVMELFKMIHVIKAHGLEKHMEKKVKGSMETMFSLSRSIDVQNAMFGALNWSIFNLTGLGCFLFACWAYHTHYLPITIGDIVLITSFFALLLNGALGLANMIPQTVKMLAALNSITPLFHRTRNVTGGRVITAIRSIAFRNVSFGYKDHLVVQNLNFTVKRGEAIAFIGPSGAGKSTTLNLILGLLTPSAGEVLIDGVSELDIDSESYRSKIAVVPQEPIFFEETVGYNLTFGIEVAHWRVEEVLKRVNLLAKINSLPDGMDTLMTHGGTNFSGGEKQRLAIARALLRDPDVLILDEATSALDKLNEDEIQKAIESFKGITIIVTHKLSTVEYVQQTIKLAPKKDLVD